MKSLFALILLLCSFDAFGEDKTYTEYILHHMTVQDYAYHILNVVDGLQTSSAMKSGYEEANPLFSSMFGKEFSDDEIVLALGAVSIIYSYMSYRMWRDDVPEKKQKFYKNFALSMKGGVVVYNYSVGVRF